MAERESVVRRIRQDTVDALDALWRVRHDAARLAALSADDARLATNAAHAYAHVEMFLAGLPEREQEPIEQATAPSVFPWERKGITPIVNELVDGRDE